MMWSCNVDWRVRQIRLNDASIQIDMGDQSRQGEISYLALEPSEVLSELNSMVSSFTLKTPHDFLMFKQYRNCSMSQKILLK